MQHLRERTYPRRLAVDRIRDQPGDVTDREWRQPKLLHQATRTANRFGGAGEGIRARAIFPVRAHHQKVGDLVRGQNIDQQLDAPRCGPLQVIEEKNQRMLAPCDHREQVAE